MHQLQRQDETGNAADPDGGAKLMQGCGRQQDAAIIQAGCRMGRQGRRDQFYQTGQQQADALGRSRLYRSFGLP